MELTSLHARVRVRGRAKRTYWMYVLESQYTVILEDNLGRELALEQPAEDGVIAFEAFPCVVLYDRFVVTHRGLGYSYKEIAQLWARSLSSVSKQGRFGSGRMSEEG